jgi:predicted nucleotidyltransferase
MRTPPPPLLPLLRSRVQAELLALLFLHPDEQFSLTEAADAINASVKAVHTEANRLVDAGLVRDARRGNLRMLQAETDSALARPLTDLLMVAYGPLAVLPEALRAVEGIEKVFVYGSWAARYRGESGAVPNDVDVLVIGDADKDALDDAARQTQQRLRREVNIRRIRRSTWETDDTDPFLRSVRSRPLVEISLHNNQGQQ